MRAETIIINDDKELCALIKRSVLQEKIETDYCYSDKTGLERIKSREYQLVEKMNGTITAESIPGEETAFTLIFPLTD